MSGVLQGGWGYVGMAYCSTTLALAAYGLWLTVRLRRSPSSSRPEGLP